MLIKLESDIRQHIRVEQQLKLHIEQVQQQADDIYKGSVKKAEENEDLKKKLSQVQKQSASSKRISDLEAQVRDLQQQHKRQVDSMRQNFDSEKSRLLAQMRDYQTMMKSIKPDGRHSQDNTLGGEIEVNYASRPAEPNTVIVDSKHKQKYVNLQQPQPVGQPGHPGQQKLNN